MAEIQSVIRGFNEKLIVPRKRESTFGTENGFGTAADTFHYAVHIEGEFPSSQAVIDTDKMVANGYRHGTTQHPRERSTPATFSVPMTPDSIAHFGTLGIGFDTVSAGDGAGDKIHTISRNSILTGINGFGYQANMNGWTVDTATDIRALGNQVKTLRISGGGRDGWARIAIETYGSGREGTATTTDGTNPYSGGINGSALWIPNNKISVGIRTVSTEHQGLPTSVTYDPPTSAGTAANLTGYTVLSRDLNTWELVVDNGLDEEMAYSSGASSGAGVYGGQCPIGENENITLNLSLLNSSTWNALHRALNSQTQSNNVEHAVRIECVLDEIVDDNYYGFVITVPLMRLLPATKWTRARGMRTASPTFEVMSDTANDLDPIYLHVLSNRASAFGATL